MLAMYYIKLVDSVWASPNILVQDKDDTLLFCIGYRKSNVLAIVIRIRYSLWTNVPTYSATLQIFDTGRK